VAGTSYLRAIERAGLELTRRVAANDAWMEENSRYVVGLGRSEVNTTCGAQVIKHTQHESICYPVPCDKETGSWVHLPPDWAKYFPAGEDFQFIGMEIQANYTNKIFPWIPITE